MRACRTARAGRLEAYDAVMRARAAGVVLGIAGMVVFVHCGGSTTGPEPEDASASDAPTSNDAGGADGAGCDCTLGRTCCNGACVNTDNDPMNCGGCGVQCMGATPFCDGTCKPLPCSGATCTSGSCCGSQCCGTGQLCCKSEGPIGGMPVCFTPTAQQPTCPQGCAPACVSDRDLKREITPIDEREVLDSLARVPMSTWSYSTDRPDVRHMGPMAQDFHAAFGLGASDRSYDPIDAHGVAFASIQALYAMVQEQGARIDRLEKENARLRSRADTCTDR